MIAIVKIKEAKPPAIGFKASAACADVYVAAVVIMTATASGWRSHTGECVGLDPRRGPRRLLPCHDQRCSRRLYPHVVGLMLPGRKQVRRNRDAGDGDQCGQVVPVPRATRRTTW